MIVNPRYATQVREHAPETAKAAFCDEVSGLRYYNPIQGRWLNRDPIEEDGGVNLYGFLENEAISTFDILGLSRYTESLIQQFCKLSLCAQKEFLDKLGEKKIVVINRPVRFNIFKDSNGTEYRDNEQPFSGTRRGKDILLDESVKGRSGLLHIFHESDHVDNDISTAYTPGDLASFNQAFNNLLSNEKRAYRAEAAFAIAAGLHNYSPFVYVPLFGGEKSVDDKAIDDFVDRSYKLNYDDGSGNAIVANYPVSTKNPRDQFQRPGTDFKETGTVLTKADFVCK